MSYSRAILERIAELAAGDARIAIQTLRNAAYNAELANKTRITEEDVEKGYEAVEEIWKGISVAPHRDRMLENYYRLMGWDVETGKPLLRLERWISFWGFYFCNRF